MSGRVVTVGMHVADILGRYVDEIAAGQSVAELEEIKMTVAGTAGATALDLGKLGVPVSTVGVIGTDAFGDFLDSALTDARVDTKSLRKDAGLPTSATILPIRSDGSRPALHVIGATGSLGPDDIDRIDLSDVKVLHLGGTCFLPGIDGEPSARLLKRAKEAGATVTMDFIPSGDHDRDVESVLPCLPYVDYFMPSDDDAMKFSGAADWDGCIDFYLARGVGTLMITMGSEGVSVSDNTRRDVRYPSFAVEVVDTTGCGDAFSAGIIASLYEGWESEEAIEFALACGSLVATGLGSDAGIETRASVTELRTTHPRRSAQI